MGRQKRIRNVKLKWPSFLEWAKDFAMRNSVVLFSLAVFLIVSLIAIRAFLHKSDYFRVRAVEVKDIYMSQESARAIAGELTRMYKGKNIINVDINEIARALYVSIPNAKSAVVRRVFPDKLLVSVNSRKPVALIYDMKYYPVDEEGFVMPSVGQAPLLKDLSVIAGIDVRLEGRRGKKLPSNNLKVALLVLKMLKEAKFLLAYGGVERIDASDVKNLSFYLKNGLEVRIGCERIKERLELLRKTLKDPRLVLDLIKYIDVRFDEAVIGPK